MSKQKKIIILISIFIILLILFVLFQKRIINFFDPSFSSYNSNDSDLLNSKEYSQPDNSLVNVSKDTTGNIKETTQTKTASVINVKDIPNGFVGAKGDNVTDDTQSFNEAIRLASTLTTKPYGRGPTSNPQGVVYVPKGEYRIKNVRLLDNVRLEIDAGAVLKQYAPTRSDEKGIELFDFGDRKSTTPLQNVSIVGVGNSSTYGNTPKPIVPAGFDITKSFTIITDPVTTNASQELKPMSIRYSNGILIQNVFAIGNSSDPKVVYPGGVDSIERIISTGVNNSALGADKNFYGPSNLTVQNLFFMGAHNEGGGAIQVQAGKNLTFNQIGSVGGIAIRLESDVSGVSTLSVNSCVKRSKGASGSNCSCSVEHPCQPVFLSVTENINISNAYCKDGQFAVSLVPHNQQNNTVSIKNSSSQNCLGTVATGSAGDPRLLPGRFTNVLIDNISSNNTYSNDTFGPALCVVDEEVVQPISVNNCQELGVVSKSNNKCLSKYSQMCH